MQEYIITGNMINDTDEEEVIYMNQKDSAKIKIAKKYANDVYDYDNELLLYFFKSLTSCAIPKKDTFSF